MTYNEVIKELKSIAQPEAIEKKKRFGLYPQDAIGVMMSDLNKIAKKIKRNDHRGQGEQCFVVDLAFHENRWPNVAVSAIHD